MQLDFSAETDLAALWVWHSHSQARACHDVIVQVSNDPTFANGVTTLPNNDYNNPAEQGKLIDAKGTKAQYVCLYSICNTANDMRHYIKVEVYGKYVTQIFNTKQRHAFARLNAGVTAFSLQCNHQEAGHL